jgi:hypothetical protein
MISVKMRWYISFKRRVPFMGVPSTAAPATIASKRRIGPQPTLFLCTRRQDEPIQRDHYIFEEMSVSKDIAQVCQLGGDVTPDVTFCGHKRNIIIHGDMTNI